MSIHDLEPQETYSLYAHEESVIRQAESMLGKLDDVANGVRVLAQAYREGYRETVRLVRISDRMQEELHAANRTLLDQAADLQQLNEVLHKEIERREALEHELRRIASLDELTGTHTRRHVLELGEHEQRRRARHGHDLALLMVDLDHFKRVNDGFGHAAGDQVLRDFGFLLRSCLRKGDIAGRFGGEEFLAILPETDLATARSIAERLCDRVRENRTLWKDHVLAVTVSIGLVTVHGDESLDKAIARADQALYLAKRAGRDRVMVGTEPDVDD
ncbi:GGDEF domain-containing protein [Allochromatium vinosum]|uniref:GGDEF domain-containing protein n=1 Tax=Allochromatium vinosum TaxID=1049 RepID=UPI0019039BBF|nr:GGDEF domain-containing protein [Allochromatium vinosum]MBK1653633.1 GGDEF domain-containing protein [Allochromatium vinosum]